MSAHLNASNIVDDIEELCAGVVTDFGKHRGAQAEAPSSGDHLGMQELRTVHSWDRCRRLKAARSLEAELRSDLNASQGRLRFDLNPSHGRLLTTQMSLPPPRQSPDSSSMVVQSPRNFRSDFRSSLPASRSSLSDHPSQILDHPSQPHIRSQIISSSANILAPRSSLPPPTSSLPDHTSQIQEHPSQSQIRSQIIPPSSKRPGMDGRSSLPNAPPSSTALQTGYYKCSLSDDGSAPPPASPASVHLPAASSKLPAPKPLLLAPVNSLAPSTLGPLSSAGALGPLPTAQLGLTSPMSLGPKRGGQPGLTSPVSLGPKRGGHPGLTSPMPLDPQPVGQLGPASPASLGPLPVGHLGLTSPASLGTLPVGQLGLASPASLGTLPQGQLESPGRRGMPCLNPANGINGRNKAEEAPRSATLAPRKSLPSLTRLF
eukprot:gene10886-17007_t